MKAIAIVELPDDAFDEYDTWIIDDEGEIRYLDDGAWMHYKDIDANGIELRPLPEKQKLTVTGKNQIEKKRIIKSKSLEQIKKGFINNSEVAFYCGYNACLAEIEGETE